MPIILVASKDTNKYWVIEILLRRPTSFSFAKTQMQIVLKDNFNGFLILKLRDLFLAWILFPLFEMTTSASDLSFILFVNLNFCFLGIFFFFPHFINPYSIFWYELEFFQMFGYVIIIFFLFLFFCFSFVLFFLFLFW